MKMRREGVVFSAGFAILLVANAVMAEQVDSDKQQNKSKGPLKVFILSGQSNMIGAAKAGTLEAVIDDPMRREDFKHLKADGKWTVRPDVWVTYLDPGNIYGPLTVGFGGVNKDKIARVGPELGIGAVLGDHYEQQVLLIKAAWGGRAVKYTFRPPGAMPGDDQIRAEVAEMNARNKKSKKPKPDVTFESRREGYGSDYRKVLSETRKVLDNIKQYFPEYDEAQGYEIAGFIWFQGWNDGCTGNPDYVDQMAQFIRDIRKDLGVPELPFVIGELGVDGANPTVGWITTFRKQQADIAALPEFKDNVRLTKTAQFWGKDWPDLSKEWAEFKTRADENSAKPENDPTRVKPGDFYKENWALRYEKERAYTSDARFHYMGSGACYYRMGQSMGKTILDLVK